MRKEYYFNVTKTGNSSFFVENKMVAAENVDEAEKILESIYPRERGYVTHRIGVKIP